MKKEIVPIEDSVKLCFNEDISIDKIHFAIYLGGGMVNQKGYKRNKEGVFISSVKEYMSEISFNKDSESIYKFLHSVDGVNAIKHVDGVRKENVILSFYELFCFLRNLCLSKQIIPEVVIVDKKQYPVTMKVFIDAQCIIGSFFDKENGKDYFYFFHYLVHKKGDISIDVVEKKLKDLFIARAQ